MTAQQVLDEPQEGWLTTAEVAALADATYRQIDFWVRLGHLHPEHEGGEGNPRRWPPGEAEIARRMARLVAAGLPLAWSAQFARVTWPAGEIADGIEVRVTR